MTFHGSGVPAKKILLLSEASELILGDSEYAKTARTMILGSLSNIPAENLQLESVNAHRIEMTPDQVLPALRYSILVHDKPTSPIDLHEDLVGVITQLVSDVFPSWRGTLFWGDVLHRLGTAAHELFKHDRARQDPLGYLLFYVRTNRQAHKRIVSTCEMIDKFSRICESRYRSMMSTEYTILRTRFDHFLDPELAGRYRMERLFEEGRDTWKVMDLPADLCGAYMTILDALEPPTMVDEPGIVGTFLVAQGLHSVERASNDLFGNESEGDLRVRAFIDSHPQTVKPNLTTAYERVLRASI